MTLVMNTSLPFPMLRRGKVRDNYDLGDMILMVATDRISAFDVVLPNGIPDKGKVLNQISGFWFQKTAHIVLNHMRSLVLTKRDLNLSPTLYKSKFPEELLGRSMLVKKAERIAVECVVRGYLSGSAWEEYRKKGTIHGVKHGPGMVESQALAGPIFTPTTKEEEGHDMPLTLEQLKSRFGSPMAKELEEKSTAVYVFARDYALSEGIIIADTKFEFGIIDGKLHLIDEILTPDSSRFWFKNKYQLGKSQSSLDKQPVRDWLLSTDWDQKPPAPALPPEIVEQTSQRYLQAYRILTGKDL